MPSRRSEAKGKAAQAKGKAKTAAAKGKAAQAKGKAKTAAAAGKSKAAKPPTAAKAGALLEAYGGWTVVKLKEALKTRGLKVGGGKDALLKRLVAAIGRDPEGDAGTVTGGGDIRGLGSLGGVRAVMTPREFDPKCKVFPLLARLTRGSNNSHSGFYSDTDTDPTKWKHIKPEDYHVTPAGYNIELDGVPDKFQVAVLEYGSHGESNSQAIGLFVETVAGHLKPVAVSIDLGCYVRGGDFTHPANLYVAQGGAAEAREYQLSNVWTVPKGAPAWAQDLFFDGDGLLPRFHHAIGEYSHGFACGFRYCTLQSETEIVEKHVPTKQEQAVAEAAKAAAKAAAAPPPDPSAESAESLQSQKFWNERPKMRDTQKKSRLQQAQQRDYTTLPEGRLKMMCVGAKISLEGSHEDRAARMKAVEIHAAEIWPKLMSY